MVDITSRGAIKSTLPAERIGSHKWNIKVQIAQTTVLGTELVTLLAVLVICALGRMRFCEAKEKREAELEYGGKLPVVVSPLKHFGKYFLDTYLTGVTGLIVRNLLPISGLSCSLEFSNRWHDNRSPRGIRVGHSLGFGGQHAKSKLKRTHSKFDFGYPSP
jgi:hypothetical protein